jgi:hypothetical protein
MKLLAEVSGGPLEGCGDAVPREMAVTDAGLAPASGQNPAYRPARSLRPPPIAEIGPLARCERPDFGEWRMADVGVG